MDLKLKFVGINENDLIATSCIFKGGNKSYRYTGTTGTSSYYYFSFKNYENIPSFPGSDKLSVGKYYHIIKNGSGAIIDIIECDDSTHWNDDED